MYETRHFKYREYDINDHEIIKPIKPVKNNKPPDPRGVAPEFFKYGSEKLFRVNTSEMVRTSINGKNCQGNRQRFMLRQY